MPTLDQHVSVVPATTTTTTAAAAATDLATATATSATAPAAATTTATSPTTRAPLPAVPLHKNTSRDAVGTRLADATIQIKLHQGASRAAVLHVRVDPRKQTPRADGKHGHSPRCDLSWRWNGPLARGGLLRAHVEVENPLRTACVQVSVAPTTVVQHN